MNLYSQVENKYSAIGVCNRWDLERNVQASFLTMDFISFSKLQSLTRCCYHVFLSLGPDHDVESLVFLDVQVQLNDLNNALLML